VRIDLPLAEHPERLRPFLVDAATLVASYGGSLSGEHGDGRARSELLGAMYSADALAAFAAFKALFDPAGLLNPGVVVDPSPVDADLRRPAARTLRPVGGFALHADGGDLTEAVHRCVGVGKCRADNADAGGFMCPSYLATGDEKDSTRGRARVLQEMTNASLLTGGWTAPEVHDALDLCLACKACARDCPVSVDMATYKAQVLHEAYRGRRRPASHYALGRLPLWLRVARSLPGGVPAFNRALAVPGVAAVAKRLAGVDHRRSIPPLAVPADAGVGATALRLRRALVGLAPTARARAGLAERSGTGGKLRSDPFEPRGSVRPHQPGTGGVGPGAPGSAAAVAVVWVDSFTAAFSPAIVTAASEVLAAAGWEVSVVEDGGCCGLTWITTGQLDGARRRMLDLLARLGPLAAGGARIVGLEPSCTAALRSDLVELLGDDPRAALVAGATRTLAEVLTEHDLSWLAGSLRDRVVIAQPHCHHHAVMGYDTDLALLRRAGAEVVTLAGCCGLAGNFGMERGHFDLSVAIAQRSLLPALRRAPAGAVLLADGFSCRTQADQLAGWPALHLAELLAGRRAPEVGAADRHSVR